MRTKSRACEAPAQKEIMRANGHAGQGGEASPKVGVAALRPAALQARREDLKARSQDAKDGSGGVEHAPSPRPLALEKHAKPAYR